MRVSWKDEEEGTLLAVLSIVFDVVLSCGCGFARVVKGERGIFFWVGAAK